LDGLGEEFGEGIAVGLQFKLLEVFHLLELQAFIDNLKATLVVAVEEPEFRDSPDELF
jgi:hypothetical protein